MKMSFVNVYGPHDDIARRLLWNDLLQVHANSNGRWCMLGDFNVVHNANERKGSLFHRRRSADFNEFIVAANLQEPKLVGRRFTWLGMGGAKLSKVDKFLISISC